MLTNIVKCSDIPCRGELNITIDYVNSFKKVLVLSFNSFLCLIFTLLALIGFYRFHLTLLSLTFSRLFSAIIFLE